jgi:hypothetical protein
MLDLFASVVNPSEQRYFRARGERFSLLVTVEAIWNH